MPKELWGEALEHCRVHGVGATARGLGIDFGRLRKLAAALTGGRAEAERRVAPTPEFVDLGPLGDLAQASGLSGGTPSMVVEVELATGDRLTIRASGANCPNALELLRELRGR
jgi:hypothetical protein